MSFNAIDNFLYPNHKINKFQILSTTYIAATSHTLKFLWNKVARPFTSVNTICEREMVVKSYLHRIFTDYIPVGKVVSLDSNVRLPRRTIQTMKTSVKIHHSEKSFREQFLLSTISFFMIHFLSDIFNSLWNHFIEYKTSKILFPKPCYNNEWY